MSTGAPAAARGRVDRPLIVALDYPDAETARALVRRLEPGRCRLKVGKELFVAAGPALVAEFAAQGHAVFLDLKFHDIPHTVAQACQAAARLGVWMLNVHASGGPRMLAAARAALDALPAPRPLLIGVTVLTSMADDELRAIGLADPAPLQVLRLARLARDAGLDGVVCSAREAALLRAEMGPAFILVTPGIRPRGAGADDQTRILTPARAVAAGADYLVIGRPITQAPDPLAALIEIQNQTEASLGDNT